jgi:hypothetical protein
MGVRLRGNSVVIVVAIALSGCSASLEFPPRPIATPEERPAGPQSPAIVETGEGDKPALCYVRARGFRGLVPLSCSEAAMVRP